MVVDTSVLLAILFREPRHDEFLQAIADASRLLVSPASLLEASIVMSTRLRGVGDLELDLLVEELAIEIVPIDRPQLEWARQAFKNFGKGRHPARLNFGDCFSYALAKATGEPLLFKGTDFAKTDIVPAVPQGT